MQRHTYTLVQFDTVISPDEIIAFRGAILNAFPTQPLFHNHIGTGFHYAYPLVQYKRINKHACIMGINEGAKALKALTESPSIPFQLHEKRKELRTTSIQSAAFTLDVYKQDEENASSCFRYYKLKDWLPLNQANYLKYHKETSLLERIKMLENILTGNIISLASGLKFFINEKICCNIVSIHTQRISQYKGVRLQSMDLTFRINMPLPPYIGIGKGASIGHGIILPTKQKAE